MKNAEWMVKHGYDFMRLDIKRISDYSDSYIITFDDEVIATIYANRIITNALLWWLDQEHEETEVKQNSVKHAHWIDMGLDDVYVCSHCDEVVVIPYGNNMLYCPNCEARMDGKDE